MLTVNLLGSPHILWHETPFDIPRRQARALLYRLAAAPGPVPREKLLYLFWPDLEDHKARRNLTRLASFLRGCLPAAEILTSGRDSITLNPELARCDARHFDRLLAQDGQSGLEEAVALYRGPFLSGFALVDAAEFEFWQGQQEHHYQEAYLAALSKMVDQKAAAGAIDAAIGYGRRYLAVDDLAEEIHRRLIELYIIAGDRAAASRQYETCLAILERELGVAPLPETRAAYEAALFDQALPGQPGAAPVAAPTWSILPSLDLPLIGRHAAWSQLGRAFERARSGGFIFIDGEPGIGKSRFLREFATATKDHLVLTGNSYAGTRDLPYQPIVQALRQALARPDLWSAVRPIWLAEVATILPEIETHFAGLPAPITVEPDQAQARLFEALSQVLTGLAARRPLLFCLDDLHWADEATLGWLIYLSSRLPGSDLCVMAAFRTHEAHPLADLRQNLRRSNLQSQISLTGLSVEAIAAVLQHLPAHNPQLPATSRQLPASSHQQLATAIHDATSGNAFFVLETIRYLSENDQLADPPADLPLPPTVQEAVRGRLDRLDPLSRQVLDVAAILSPDVTFELLAPVAGRSDGEIVDGVESLLDRQLLAGAGDRLHFQHELARAVVYEDLSHWRRRLLHRRAAETLEERHGGRTNKLAGQIATHYDAAGAVELAKSFYHDAALFAQSQYAYREANHYLRRIADLPSGAPVDPDTTGRLYESLADNYRTMADFAAAEPAYRRALQLDPSGPGLWQADVLRKLAAVLKPQLRFEEADELYTQAFDILETVPVDPRHNKRRHWLEIQLDRLDLYYGQARVDDMLAVTAEIAPLVRELDVPHLWSQYYAAVTRVRAFLERFAFSAESVQIARERLGHALPSQNVREIADQQFGLGFVLLWAGELEQALDALQSALATTEEIGHLFVQIQCLAYLSILHRLRGDVDKARYYLRRTTRITEVPKHRYYVGVAHSTRAWLAYRESDWLVAVEEARAALRQWSGTIYPFAWLANWIILAHAMQACELGEAKSVAAAMLSPEQQRLPGDVTAALEMATSSSDEDSIRAALIHALSLAKAYGYL